MFLFQSANTQHKNKVRNCWEHSPNIHVLHPPQVGWAFRHKWVYNITHDILLSCNMPKRNIVLYFVVRKRQKGKCYFNTQKPLTKRLYYYCPTGLVYVTYISDNVIFNHIEIKFLCVDMMYTQYVRKRNFIVYAKVYIIRT